MASAFTHAFVGTLLGKTIKTEEKTPLRFWIALALLSALPDIDVIGYHMGVPYDSPWGHRGFTHSLLFALIISWVTLELLRLKTSRFSKGWWVNGICLFLATASHGFLDAFTTGGMGVAFFWPFDNTRYFFPNHPVLVSPLTVGGFFTERGWNIIQSELYWVWLPTILFYGISRLVGWGFRKQPAK